MKRIAYIIATVFLTAGITACSSDDLVGTGSTKSSVAVVKQNVCFDAPASQGTIEFTAPAAANVTATADWCTATLSGNTINVSVPQNNDYNSRACDVIIKCGNDSARVNVVQNGYVFQLSAGTSVVANRDMAQTLSYNFKSNLPFTFSSDADWFTVENKDGKLNITVAENNTGHVRKGWIFYEAGDLKDSLSVTQYEFAKDIAGAAYLYYYNADGKLYRTNIELTESSMGLVDYAKYGDWRIPFTFDDEANKFIFPNAQNAGMYSGKYYVAACIFGGGYASYYKEVSWDAPLDYYPEDGLMEADMIDNGSWSYAFEGFHVRAFKSETFSSSTLAGTLLTMYSPMIVRFDPEPAAAKAKIPARYSNAEVISTADFAKMLGM